MCGSHVIKQDLQVISNNTFLSKPHLFRFLATHNATTSSAYISIPCARIIIYAPITFVGVVHTVDAVGEFIALVKVKISIDYLLSSFGCNGQLYSKETWMEEKYIRINWRNL